MNREEEELARYDALQAWLDVVICQPIDIIDD